jgi:hypothetical protein
MVEQDPYKYLYNEYQMPLHDIAHHNKYPDEAAYVALLRDMEYFLLRYVLPSQAEVYRLLEETLKGAPESADPHDLRMLVRKNVESTRFFFKRVDARWLPYLKANGFLDATWEVGEYLSRIATEDPDGMLGVFLQTAIPANAHQAKTAFSQAASKLPPPHAAGTVQKILDEGWVRDTRGSLLHYRLQDLLETLVSGTEYAPALALADALLDVFPKEYGSYGSMDVKSYISEYEYDQVVQKLLTIPAPELPPFLKMFVSKLVDVVIPTHVRNKEREDDYSHIWRPAIEPHPQNRDHRQVEDCIIAAIRDMLELRVAYWAELGLPDNARAELEEVLSHTRSYRLLTRFKLHIYRRFPVVFSAEIKQAVSNPDLSTATWHEYSLLAQAHFGSLSPAEKSKYFAVVARLIGLVKDYLTPAQKKKYATLIKRVAKLDQPYFTSYHDEATWVGPNSPKSEADLEGKPVSEIIELIKTWEPTGDKFFGPSRSGFGWALRNVITKEGPKYSAAAMDFLQDGVKPVYMYNLLSGLAESAKTKVDLDWTSILNLASGIVARAKESTLPPDGVDEDGDQETGWRDVMQETARILVRGLDTNAITLKEKDRVWAIIEYLVEHPDPTAEHENKYGSENTDPYTMSINTVRGEAFHALFAYIFWYNRAEETSAKTWKARVPAEAKRVLEAHLDPAHDSSLTVRSVYGRFLPWLFSYGGDWAKALVPQLFPADPNMRYAVWETYLSHMVFTDAYKLLRPQYEQAVKDVREGKVPKRRYWADAVERLAEHTMIAYAFEADNKQDPFYDYFFANASGKCRGMAVSIGGRAFISRDTPKGDKVPKVEVLKKFWDWRLAESDAPSELREFGWWTKLGKFEDGWMLERLLTTVEKTKGDIDGEYIVMCTVEALAGNHPLLCAKILKQIFSSSNQRDRYAFMHMGELRSAMEKILQTETPRL